jgi:hypothetical protein
MRVIKAMDCKACRNLIEVSPTGETSSARAAALAHMDGCARCRDFSAERRALLELVSSLEGISAPHDFEWRLRARLNADKHRNQDRPRLRPGFAPNARAIALAASFALLIGVAVIFKQRSNEAYVARPAGELVNVDTANAVKPSGEDTINLSEARGASTNGTSRINTTASLTSNRARVASPTRAASEAKKTSKETSASSSVVAAASASTVRSNDFSSSAAPVVTLFAVPVKDPSQHLKLLLDEGHGTPRTVRLQNITFGAQSIFERQMSGAAVAERSLDTNADGIW